MECTGLELAHRRGHLHHNQCLTHCALILTPKEKSFYKIGSHTFLSSDLNNSKSFLWPQKSMVSVCLKSLKSTFGKARLYFGALKYALLVFPQHFNSTSRVAGVTLCFRPLSLATVYCSWRQSSCPIRHCVPPNLAFSV